MRAPARGFFATRMLAHPRGPYMTAGLISFRTRRLGRNPRTGARPLGRRVCEDARDQEHTRRLAPGLRLASIVIRHAFRAAPRLRFLRRAQ
jgi:hypothetical protein